jgi:hypothetical protein
MTKQQFLDLSLEEQVITWNDFASEHGWDTHIYDNDEFTLDNLYHGSAYKLAYHIHFGEYDYNDTYFYYDDLGRLISFSDELTFRGLIDIDEMITWYNNTYKGEE